VNRLAEAYTFGGELETAVRLLKEVLEKQSVVFGPTHPSTVNSMVRLAFTYRDTGQFAEAMALYERAFALREATFGPGHDPINERTNYAEVCQRARRLDQADLALHQALEQEREAKDSLLHRNTMANILGFKAANLLFQERFDEAELLARQVVAMHPLADVKHDYWVCVLGAALFGQREYAEAERLLLQGYEGMKRNEALHPAIRRRMTEVGEWVVRLYEETDQPEKAQAWAEKLAAAHGHE
jgi:tetratricopeptide (TPR) repeat protein